MNRLLGLAALFLCLAAFGQGQDQWPQFRGPHASGIGEGSPVPTRWYRKTGDNIRWHTPIPGLGHSSPVIWGDRLFVTTAVDAKKPSELKVGLYGDIQPVAGEGEQSWRVYCLNTVDGKIVWERTAHQGNPRTPRHPKSTHANPTPATDGKHVVVFFGSKGLYCYDFSGELLWKKDLGVLDSGFFIAPEAQWGFASSPVIHDGLVIVQCDVLREQYLAALRVEDGREVWRTKRQDVPTWSTPAIIEDSGVRQVVVNGYKQIAGYELGSGEEVWRMRGGGDIPVPTPVFGHGLIFFTNAHGGGSPIIAVRPGAKGDISLEEGQSSNEYVAWRIERGGAYMQTPLVLGNYLYVCRDNGVLSCYDARSGERKYEQRLGSGRTGFSASMVSSGGRLYITSEDGDVHVIRAGPDFEQLAKNAMDAVCMATPAIADGSLYYRTRGEVIAIGPKGGSQ